MKLVFLRRLGRSRYTLAVTAGLLLAASFPGFNLSGFAWIAPGLMLAAAAGRRGGEAFRLGYAAGLAHYLVSLYWLSYMPSPLGAVAAWLALSAYLALYPAVWTWLCWRGFPGALPSAPGLAAGAGVASEVADWVMATSRLERAVWAVLCAVTWVALEMVVGLFLTGFPWNFLGVSQYQVLPLIQIASVTGVYGVSFLVAWVSVTLGCAVAAAIGRPTVRWIWLAEVGPALLGAVAAATFGFSQLGRDSTPARSLKVALVQPSIPQALIWDPKEDPKRFQQIMQLSEQALAGRPDLLVWPETALPEFTEENFRALANLVASHRVWMVFGAEDDESNPPPGTAEKELHYNAAFLMNPSGHLEREYRKQRLVVFGEYVPFRAQLPFLKYLTPVDVDDTPGKEPVQFRLTRPSAQCSVLICFEDTFPALARRAVEKGTDFLLNLTNDGWFGESAEQWQHAANAVFRAVENGLPLVRCTNNGLTCWIDARGRMHGIYFPGDRDVYRAGFKTARIPLLAAGASRRPTVYQRHGDWFGWGCIGLTAWARVVRRRRGPLGASRFLAGSQPRQ